MNHTTRTGDYLFALDKWVSIYSKANAAVAPGWIISVYDGSLATGVEEKWRGLAGPDGPRQNWCVCGKRVSGRAGKKRQSHVGGTKRVTDTTSFLAFMEFTFSFESCLFFFFSPFLSPFLFFLLLLLLLLD
jgi:hypothetical protein